MSLPVAFAGMVPGGVGFSQINFNIPQAFAPGTYDLTGFIAGEQSNTVKLIVQ